MGTKHYSINIATILKNFTIFSEVEEGVPTIL